MKRIISNWQILFFLFVPFFLFSCEERDPEVEFQKILDTPFTNIKQSINALDEYIDYFSGNASEHLDEADQMRREFSAMENLFRESFTDYEQFMDEVSKVENKGEDSKFACVREAWRQLFQKEKHTLLDPGLEKLDQNSFVAYMKENAMDLCKDGRVIMKADECDVVEMGEPQLTEDGFSKTCEGTFRVHLKGKLVGLLKSTALIKLKGKIVGDGIPTFQYKMVEYEILEAPTELKDVIATAAKLLI